MDRLLIDEYNSAQRVAEHSTLEQGAWIQIAETMTKSFAGSNFSSLSCQARMRTRACELNAKLNIEDDGDGVMGDGVGLKKSIFWTEDMELRLQELCEAPNHGSW